MKKFFVMASVICLSISSGHSWWPFSKTQTCAISANMAPVYKVGNGALYTVPVIACLGAIAKDPSFSAIFSTIVLSAIAILGITSVNAAIDNATIK